MHIEFDEFEELENQNKIIEEEDEETQNNQNSENTIQRSSNEEHAQSPSRSSRTVDYRPQEQIIGDNIDGVRTRRSFQNNDMAMISQIDPKSIKEAIIDESWVEATK